MRVAVCDDSRIDRELFVAVLHHYFVNKPISNEIVQYENGMDLLHDVEDDMWFDIIFLDIYMNDLLGIDVAHKLRSLGYRGHIIFFTASSIHCRTCNKLEIPYQIKMLQYLLCKFFRL